MKYLLILCLFGCKSTLMLEVERTNGNKEIVNVKARKSICIASFENDSIEKLVDYKGRVLLDSVIDYKVIKVK